MQLTDFLSPVARVTPVRIAVLADIHGNLPALRAVLDELDREPVDAIVVAGDVVGGPLVRETLELLAARREPTRWVRGNCEREAVAIYDGAPVSDDPAGRAAAWSAQALDSRWRDELAAWPISLGLDDVRFCHGSPRRDDEILTRTTPDDVLTEALADVAEPLIVGGHTHQQMVRNVARDRHLRQRGQRRDALRGPPGRVLDDRRRRRARPARDELRPR